MCQLHFVFLNAATLYLGAFCGQKEASQGNSELRKKTKKYFHSSTSTAVILFASTFLFQLKGVLKGVLKGYFTRSRFASNKIASSILYFVHESLQFRLIFVAQPETFNAIMLFYCTYVAWQYLFFPP